MDFPKIFEELEQQAELLIETCKDLKTENARLQEANRVLTQRNQQLHQRNQQVADRISAIINQLKHVSQEKSYE